MYVFHGTTAVSWLAGWLQMKSRLERVVTQAMQRLQKKIESLRKQGGQSDRHLQTQKLADLLMANVHRCPL